MDENLEKESMRFVSYFRSGTLGNFDTKLFIAYQHADLFNRGKLAALFPIMARGYEIWFHNLDQTVEEKKEVRKAR